MTAWTLSGISTWSMPAEDRQRSPSWTRRPSLIRWRMISSRKNGLPSERSRIRLRTRSGSWSTPGSSDAEPGALVVAERVERQRAEVAPAASPVGARAEQVRTRGAEEEDRAVQPLGQLLEDVEHRRVGPVQVLDDGDDREAPRERGEERAPRLDELAVELTRVERLERVVERPQPERRGEGGRGAPGVDRRCRRRRSSSTSFAIFATPRRRRPFRARGLPP